MPDRAWNPRIICNFAFANPGEIGFVRKCVAFFRGWTEIAKYRTEPTERRILRSSACLYASKARQCFATRIGTREGRYSFFSIGFMAFGDAWSNIEKAMKSSLFLCLNITPNPEDIGSKPIIITYETSFSDYLHDCNRSCCNMRIHLLGLFRSNRKTGKNLS